MQHSHRILVLAALAALAASGVAQAQNHTLKLGAVRYDTHAKTSGITGVGIPPGADATIGDASTALKNLAHTAPELLERYYRPEPRLAAGQRLRGIATACIDVSDGLVADLGHLCAASGVGARLTLADIPLTPGGDVIGMITGGDDYELLFTCATTPPDLGDVAVTRIGTVVAAHGVVIDGYNGPIEGYRHF